MWTKKSNLMRKSGRCSRKFGHGTTISDILLTMPNRFIGQEVGEETTILKASLAL